MRSNTWGSIWTASPSRRSSCWLRSISNPENRYCNTTCANPTRGSAPNRRITLQNKQKQSLPEEKQRSSQEIRQAGTGGSIYRRVNHRTIVGDGHDGPVAQSHQGGCFARRLVAARGRHAAPREGPP